MLLLTRNSTKDFYPERPTGAKDLSSNPKQDFYPAEYRDDRRFRPCRKGSLFRTSLPPYFLTSRPPQRLGPALTTMVESLAVS